MKSLLLIRHAKSSWNFNVDDYDRPLNERGESNAPEMAKRLKKKEIKIDAFVSSPALRAFTTAKFFAEAYDVKEKKIQTIGELYEPTISAFYTAIESLDDDIKTVAVFSHNPGITEFANRLTETRIDDMPTCAVFAIKISAKQWKDFASAEKEFWFFDYPKSSD